MIRHFVVTLRMWRGVTFAPGRFTAGPPAKYLRRACDWMPVSRLTLAGDVPCEDCRAYTAALTRMGVRFFR